jgi:prepilin-type N-terminal cleavage/methylation domain-containing protein
MEFKSKSARTLRRAGRAGFTLVELLIASGLSGLLLVVLLSLSLYTARGFASVTNSIDLNARSRLAIDRIGQKLRQASAVQSYSPTSVTVTYSGQPLTYSYNPDQRTLVENEAGVSRTLVENCEELRFAFYKRNPVGNSFNQFPVVTSASEAKAIQVSWLCSRTLVGLKSGAAEMVSAKVVLRAK